MKPWQAKEVEAGALGHAAVVCWLPGPVKNWDVNPAKIRLVAGAPDNSSQWLGREIDAGIFSGAWLPTRGVRSLDWRLDTLLRNPAINAAADAAVHRISMIKVVRKILVEADVLCGH